MSSLLVVAPVVDYVQGYHAIQARCYLYFASYLVDFYTCIKIRAHSRVVNRAGFIYTHAGLYLFVAGNVKILYSRVRTHTSIDSIKWAWIRYDDTHIRIAVMI